MLELDLTTIIFEIINFLVLTVLLYRFLFQPVMRNVKARAVEKERLLTELTREREKLAEDQRILDNRLTVIDDEIKKNLADARAALASERATLIEQTHQEADRILAEARQDAQLWRKQALKGFHQEILQTILDLSGWAINAVAPSDLHDTLVHQLSDRIWELGRHEIRRVDAIRQSLGEREPTAYITTARPLSVEQQDLLTRTFSALADQNVTLNQQTDPALALGLKARLGDILIDNTLAGQLMELRDEVLQSLDARLSQTAT